MVRTANLDPRRRGRQAKKTGAKARQRNPTRSKRRDSPTYYRDRANPAAFSFAEEKGWLYIDKDEAKNRLAPLYSNDPHLVLKDGGGEPRFVLRYKKYPRQIVVRSIQRARTQYRKRKGEAHWSARAETRASKKFQVELGMHPMEFLLSELIFRNRKRILEGDSLILDLIFPAHDMGKVNELYRPLVDRFFGKKPISLPEGPGVAFELDKKKERVKAILGLD